MYVIVMGLSGCGKSSVGTALAKRLDAVFLEGDDLHPPKNVAWMTKGKPLTDEMRWPWLDACGAALVGQSRAVLACSSLKRSYRDRLRQTVPDVRFVFCNVPYETVAQRLDQRRGHFMPPSLLQSQFDTLEPPTLDERAIVVDGTASIEDSAKQAAEALAG